MISPDTIAILDKIEMKSRHMLLQASKGYKPHSSTAVPYEASIVRYEDKLYLMHKNIIFERNSIADSSYDIWLVTVANKEVTLIKQDVKKIGREFFRNLIIIKNIR